MTSCARGDDNPCPSSLKETTGVRRRTSSMCHRLLTPLSGDLLAVIAFGSDAGACIFQRLYHTVDVCLAVVSLETAEHVQTHLSHRRRCVTVVEFRHVVRRLNQGDTLLLGGSEFRRIDIVTNRQTVQSRVFNPYLAYFLGTEESQEFLCARQVASLRRHEPTIGGRVLAELLGRIDYREAYKVQVVGIKVRNILQSLIG